jgi:hypothetical protein
VFVALRTIPGKGVAARAAVAAEAEAAAAAAAGVAATLCGGRAEWWPTDSALCTSRSW